MRLRRPFLGLILVFLVCGASLVWVKREGLLHHFGALRAGSLLRQSEKSGQEGEWKNASRKALAAWQLHRGNYRILQQLYVSLLNEESPDALIVAGLVLNHPEAVLDDKIEVMDVFLKAGDHVSVARFLASLTADEHQLPGIKALGARLLVERGRPLEALSLIDQLRHLRTDDQDLLLAADALSRIRSEGNLAVKESQRLIELLFRAGHDPSLALKAFSILGRIPPAEREVTLFADSTERLRRIEKCHVSVPAGAWLLASEIEFSLAPGRRDQILAAALNRWKNEAPGVVGEWLITIGEPDLVLQHCAANTALNESDLLSLRVRAHLLKDEWNAASALIHEVSPAINPVIIPGLRACLATKAGKEVEADQLWNRSLHQAELVNSRQSYVELSRLAALAGNTRVKTLATTEALKIPSVVPVASSDVSFVFSDLRNRNKPADLLEISLNLLASEPGNAQLLNNVVWLELLHGVVNEERIAGLSRMVEQFPTIVGMRTTLAFARVSQGMVDEALRLLDPVMEKLESPDESITATDLAVTAYALVRKGETGKARAAAGHLEWGSMMKIEADFFRSALKPANPPASQDS